MVYCGKPSRGCQMCRSRRIKCDETKPTCNQCSKSRRVCPGYKDDFDLVFRNETQATERRARRTLHSKKASAQLSFAAQQVTFAFVPPKTEAKDDAEPLAASGAVVDMSMLQDPIALPAIPFEQKAPCYFVTNYVMTPRHASRGYFDFLMPMLKSERPDSHLSLAFAAVSYAALANQPNTRGAPYQTQAIGHYATALKALNLALQNPAQQKTDQTLAAIVMLGFFENIASERTNAMAWYSHVDGAVQLVKMRGKKQLRTKIGYSLFASVRTQMVVSALSGSKAPTLGSDWWVNETAKNDADVFVTKLNIRVAELRMEINHALTHYPRTPEYFQEVLNLMKRAQAMEQEYIEWESRLPAEWLPRTVAWVGAIPDSDIGQADVCPGKVDMYADVFVAGTWNQARVARLFISGSIVRCAAWVCSPVDYRTTPEYANTVRLSGDLVTDIIASIPYHFGWRVTSDGILKGGDLTGYNSETEEDAAPKAIGGFFCMWPLFSITNTDYISDTQRAWAKGRLIYISEHLGLNHARVLSTFGFRLPSMIIRRDMMIHQAQLGQAYNHGFATPAASAASHTSPTSSNLSQHVTTTTIHKLAQTEDDEKAKSSPPQGFGDSSPSSAGTSNMEAASGSGSSLAGPTLNPFQQREAMQRETWEKEREGLLRRAGNGQGDSMERLVANYLAV